jgi:hypothetical protein
MKNQKGSPFGNELPSTRGADTNKCSLPPLPGHSNGHLKAILNSICPNGCKYDICNTNKISIFSIYRYFRDIWFFGKVYLGHNCVGLGKVSHAS